MFYTVRTSSLRLAYGKVHLERQPPPFTYLLLYTAFSHSDSHSQGKIDNFSSSVLGALSKCVFALHATISKFVYRVWRNTMYLGSHLDNKSLGEMDVIFWSILKVYVFSVFLKLKVLVLVARAEKVPHFLCYKKSVLIREQDAELAGATDRPIVIQKNTLNFSICLTSQLRSI